MTFDYAYASSPFIHSDDITHIIEQFDAGSADESLLLSTASDARVLNEDDFSPWLVFGMVYARDQGAYWDDVHVCETRSVADQPLTHSGAAIWGSRRAAAAGTTTSCSRFAASRAPGRGGATARCAHFTDRRQGQRQRWARRCANSSLAILTSLIRVPCIQMFQLLVRRGRWRGQRASTRSAWASTTRPMHQSLVSRTNIQLATLVDVHRSPAEAPATPSRVVVRYLTRSATKQQQLSASSTRHSAKAESLSPQRVSRKRKAMDEGTHIVAVCCARSRT